jgi:hypothetical protein
MIETMSEMMSDVTSNTSSDSGLEHPWEKTIFIASVVLNVAIFFAAFLLLRSGNDWLNSHPLLAKSVDYVKGLAVAMVFAPPALVLIRNVRRGLVRGNAVRLSKVQMPEMFAILEKHCRRLGIPVAPALYVTDHAIHEPAMAYSAWKQHYIVFTEDFLELETEKVRDVLGFLIGREVGRIRLGHTSWWHELMLAYVIRIPYLKNPMTQVETLSHDRYGAFLAPDGIRGLAIQACGRRLLPGLNLNDYVRQVREYGGFWEGLSNMLESTPHVSYRIKALIDAGFLPAGQLAGSAPIPG